MESVYKTVGEGENVDDRDSYFCSLSLLSSRFFLICISFALCSKFGESLKVISFIAFIFFILEAVLVRQSSHAKENGWMELGALLWNNLIQVDL
jgi:hypothetical protein